MSFFNVNEQKCKRCSICKSECPNHLILMDSETGLPKLRIQGENDCILCGHCVAACPFDALHLEPLSKEGFTPVDKNLNITFEQSDQFLKSRRSIRAYKKTAVPNDVLQKIMDVARFAPTASHRQTIRWIMVEDPVKTNRIAEMVIDWMTMMRKEQPEVAKRYRMAGLIAGWRKGHDMILRGAPHLAIAYTDKKSYWYALDAAIALTYVELAAHGLGVAACWAGFFTQAIAVYPPLKEYLDLPEDAQVHGGQMLGFAKSPYPRLPWRKPLDIKYI